MAKTDMGPFVPRNKDVKHTLLGVAAGVAAQTVWGFSVLLWPLLRDLPTVSILAHRMLWSWLLLLVVILLTKRWADIKAAVKDRQSCLILVLNAIILSSNWGLFIWAVNRGMIVSTSLGYYITPLINVLMGRIFLGEQMTRPQMLAILLAGMGVAWGIIGFGNVPWVGLILAVTFALYGYFQKTVNVDAVPSLFLEITILSPLALAWLFFAHPGDLGVIGHGPVRLMLVSATMLATAVPLMFFSYAARHINLSSIGIIQYVSPSISFLLAIFITGEKIKDSDFVTFPMLWCALAIYTWDAVRTMRRMKATAQGKHLS